MNDYKQLELDFNIENKSKNSKFLNISNNLLSKSYNKLLKYRIINIKNYLNLPFLNLDNVINKSNFNIKIKFHLLNLNLISNNFQSFLNVLDINSDLTNLSNKNLDEINSEINFYLNSKFDLLNTFKDLNQNQKIELINSVIIPKICNLIEYSLSFMEFQNDLKSTNKFYKMINNFSKINNTSIDNIISILKNDDFEKKFDFFNFKNTNKIIINKDNILNYFISQDQVFAKNFLLLQNLSILISTIQDEIKNMPIENKEKNQLINLIDSNEIKFKNNITTIGDVKLNIINSLSNEEFVSFLSKINSSFKPKKINLKN